MTDWSKLNHIRTIYRRENCVQLDLNILGKVFTVYKSDNKFNYWLKQSSALDGKEQLKPTVTNFKI